LIHWTKRTGPLVRTKQILGGGFAKREVLDSRYRHMTFLDYFTASEAFQGRAAPWRGVRLATLRQILRHDEWLLLSTRPCSRRPKSRPGLEPADAP
jgi:hypothetical protein